MQVCHCNPFSFVYIHEFRCFFNPPLEQEYFDLDRFGTAAIGRVFILIRAERVYLFVKVPLTLCTKASWWYNIREIIFFYIRRPSAS